MRRLSRRSSTTEQPGSEPERTRLTPKSAKDVKVIRISSLAYNAVYVYATKHNMTMTDAVSFMVETAWNALFKMPLTAAQKQKVTQLDELEVSVNRMIVDALSKHTAGEPMRHGS